MSPSGIEPFSLSLADLLDMQAPEQCVVGGEGKDSVRGHRSRSSQASAIRYIRSSRALLRGALMVEKASAAVAREWPRAAGRMRGRFPSPEAPRG